ncbi:LysE family transporter [Methanomicrobium sp. W14]|uniref:LysE family transporter n=1 Tax=Methanomicrobium sp. W14 TaxID=2817839 RepID=UPI003742D6C2
MYIALSYAGIAVIISRKRVQAAVIIAGCLVLVMLGVNTIAGAFDISFLPRIALFSDVPGRNLFVQGLLLTASNPLTIVFWSGVVSAQILVNKWNKKQVFFLPPAVSCLR